MKRFKVLIATLCMLLLFGLSFARITNYPGASADPETCWGAVGAEVCVDKNGNIIPTTNDNQDLGTSSLKWKNLYLSGTTTSDGDLTVTGTLDVTGDSSLDGALTVNDNGADKDTRIEGDTDINLLFVDAGNDRVGIGTNTPAVLFDVDGVFNATQMTINEAGADLDSRIEGDTNANLFYTDAGNDRVGIGTNSPATLLDVAGVFSSTNFIINEAGADLDSRIEGDADANLFYTDAGNDRIGIGTATPSTKLDVQGTVNITGATAIDNAVTINDSGADVDFRVESDNQANMLVVDAGTDTVIVGGGTGIKEILTNTAALDFPSITAQTDEDLTITVTGAAVGDACHLGLPAAPTGNLAWNCFVSATDTVTVRVHNYTGGAIDPASATYRVVTFGY